MLHLMLKREGRLISLKPYFLISSLPPHGFLASLHASSVGGTKAEEKTQLREMRMQFKGLMVLNMFVIFSSFCLLQNYAVNICQELVKMVSLIPVVWGSCSHCISLRINRKAILVIL